MWKTAPLFSVFFFFFFFSSVYWDFLFPWARRVTHGSWVMMLISSHLHQVHQGEPWWQHLDASAGAGLGEDGEPAERQLLPEGSDASWPPGSGWGEPPDAAEDLVQRTPPWLVAFACHNTSLPRELGNLLVRAPDLWSKGCEFESQQEQWENLLLQS